MKKHKVPCPKCNFQLQVDAQPYIRFQCPVCSTILELENGKLKGDKTSSKENAVLPKSATVPEATSSMFTGNLAKVSMLICGIFLIILVTMIYMNWLNLEDESYTRIMANPKVTKIEEHLKNYSNGKYGDELRFIKDSLYYNMAMNEYDAGVAWVTSRCERLDEASQKVVHYRKDEMETICEDCYFKVASNTSDFNTISIYESRYPEGRYMDSIDLVKNRLWDRIEEQYLARSKRNNIPNDRVDFVKSLLEHSRRTGSRTIEVSVLSRWNLKDWENYSQEAKDYVDAMIQVSNVLENVSHPLPSANPPPGISRAIGSNIQFAENGIVNILQRRLDSLFVPNPFKAVRKDQPLSQDTAGIVVECEILNLEESTDDISYPVLYIRTNSDDDDDSPIFQRYVLGISMDWDFQFKVPDSSEGITFSSTSKPDDSFSNLSRGSMVYNMMVRSAYENYMEEISDDLGF